VKRNGDHDCATDDGTACGGLGGLPEPARRPDALRNHRRRGDPIGKPDNESIKIVSRELLQKIWTPKSLRNDWARFFTPRFDFVIRRAPVRTRQPDLFFLSRERLHDWAHLQEQPRLEFAPDLVIEILSPSDTYTYWSEKLQDYFALGVPEVWLVDVDKRAIEVQVREAGGYRSLGWFAGEQAVASQVLAGSGTQACGGVRRAGRVRGRAGGIIDALCM
jgi:Uma2 family endonuclease